ncbi:phosphonate ABC transporter substrate-binding protein [Pseudomonas sp. 3A(2025)]
MFHRFGRRLVSVVIFASCLLGVAQAAPQTLHFGILSTESQENLKSIWQPLLDDMARTTGFDVQPVYTSDYAGLIDGLGEQRVDVAWLGNMAAVEAVDRSDSEIFAQTSMVNGTHGYQGLLIARKDSAINTVDDLLRQASHLSFGNGDPNSTSGYLVPGYYVFARQHINPATAFKRTLNQSHEANALSVAKGEVDAATFNSENWDRLSVTHPQQLAQLKIIWKSPLIPADPIVWRRSLLPDNKVRIRAFFLGYGATDEQKAVLKGLQQTHFSASNNNQLLPIRQLRLFKERTDVAASDLSVDEKKRRFREIDEALARLQDRIKALEKSRP